MTTLRVDWCSHAAAKFAVEHWHYSRSLPGADKVKVGAWEDGRFIGVVMFSRGATPEIASPFNLRQTEVCELTRIALDRHTTPVSRIVAIALRFLREHCPGLRLVVSFADAAQGHHGGIYQAGNWLYVGSQEYHAYRVRGEIVHPKTLHSKYGKGGQSIPWLRAHVDPAAERIRNGMKHKYLMPLDEEIRRRLAPLARPYPKRAGSIVADAPVVQTGEGGSVPTPALPGRSARSPRQITRRPTRGRTSHEPQSD